MKVKVESEIVGLKLNIQKTEIMASGPITSWEIFFWAPKSLQMVTAAMKFKDGLLVTPWTAARQASLPFTISQIFSNPCPLSR